MRSLFAAALLLTAGLLAGAEIPRPAPELTFVAHGGMPVKLSSYKGKVVVVEIISTTCPHCQNSAVILSKLNKELGPKGFQPLGMAINDGADVGAFIRTYAVNFPVGTGKRDDAFAFLQHSVMSPSFYFPQMVFIDKKGVIRAQYSGTDSFLQSNEEANIRNLVQKLLAEPNAAKPASPAKSKKAS